MSLAHTHSVLTEDVWQTASLRGLLENELRPYADGEMRAGTGGRVELDGPAVDLPSEIAVPIGMAIHELTTNAAKYGALSNRSAGCGSAGASSPGRTGRGCGFHWQESGGPAVAPPTRQGFGSRCSSGCSPPRFRPRWHRLRAGRPLADHAGAAAARNAALNPLATL